MSFLIELDCDSAEFWKIEPVIVISLLYFQTRVKKLQDSFIL
ncbi:hypothetical protein HMPREF1557_01110 [Streptococcus sobrinus W1703]|uniref:Uncharacterized protein n=1 Tax=Streptococcus sobrinus W1703 TaxID=1227275 RepID=U2IQM0_9STRE|nr:hypothetical protein HMPREF1557_01110 [Streptococcus sobrinus W1703]